MGIIEISKMPTILEVDERGKYSESGLRAYNILEHVKHYLDEGVPQRIILELIADMEAG